MVHWMNFGLWNYLVGYGGHNAKYILKFLRRYLSFQERT